MLNSQNNLDPNSVDFTLVRDLELNGEINRASQQGAKFALLLAMLEPNTLFRPRLEQGDLSEDLTHISPELHHYPSSSLAVESEYWQSAENTAKLIESGHIASAHLWLAMHPEPLSLFNNPAHIDENIVTNASVFAQSRLNNEFNEDLKVDETSLFDILDELKATSA